jgi:hypothetical protein
MKKLLAILMCAALIFSFAACGAGNDVDDKTPDNAVEDDVNVDNEADAEEETEADDTTKPEDTTAAPETQPTEATVSRGEVNGDVYTNAFAGFTFTKPADWAYLTDEEIAQTIDLGSEVVDLNAIEEALAKKASIYDMAVQDAYGNSVMICYENTMLSAFREISLDEYESIMKTNLEAVPSIDYTFQSSEDIKLGDATYRKMLFSAEAQGVTMSQAYYARVIGKYVITVILTSSNEDIATMEAMFTK